MSIRSLVIGMIVILLGGAVGVILLRQTDDEGVQAAADAERTDPRGDTFPPAAPPLNDTTGSAHLVDVGTPAPSFELERLDGESFSLENHRGRVILLNFWATWCEPCREEMPDLQQLWEAYEADGLLVVGVSLDEEGRSIVKEFHETFPVEYPLLLNGSPTAAVYGADHFVPTTFLIGRDGRILDRHVGAITREEFEDRVRAVL